MLEQAVGFAGVYGVAEAVAELLGGQGDRQVLVGGVGEDWQGCPQRGQRSGSTPLIWAASMAMAPAARSWPSSFSAIMPPKEWPIRMGLAGRPAMIAA